MEALKSLLAMPKPKQDKISSEFGSVTELYKMIFILEKESYFLHSKKPNGYQKRLHEIQSEYFSIEDKLDELDLGIDGHDIVTDIAGDYSEIVANGIAKQTDNYLKEFGLTFDDMRKWIQGNIE